MPKTIISISSGLGGTLVSVKSPFPITETRQLSFNLPQAAVPPPNGPGAVLAYG